MRSTYLIVSILLFSVLFAACGERPPKEAGVVVIIIDGLRPDKLQIAHTPMLDEFQAGGAFTSRARAVMPTATRVNFVTFTTGVHADIHGVIGGTYRDREYKEQRTDRPTYREAQERVPLPTIFEILEDHGKRTGIFAMKGYELVGARGAGIQKGDSDLFPDEIWRYRYEEEIDGSAEEALKRKIHMNEILIDTLAAVLEDEHLDFILVNLGASDYIGHVYGPESDAYREALEATDRQVSQIAGLLKNRYPTREWYYVIGSDHGFSQTNREQVALPADNNPNLIPELIRRNIEHALYERGGRSAELYLSDQNRIADAFLSLSRLPWIKRIYTNHTIEGRAGSLDDLRVAYPGHHGDFYIITEPSYALNFANFGQHGSNDDIDVLVPLYIYAPDRIKPGTVIEGASNLDIAPTLMQLFRIDDERIVQMEGKGLVK
jgi:predicted AlkP superfamily pyrophosphatase or phosphodiesterase